jgi:hypothetical protein
MILKKNNRKRKCLMRCLLNLVSVYYVLKSLRDVILILAFK